MPSAFERRQQAAARRAKILGSVVLCVIVLLAFVSWAVLRGSEADDATSTAARTVPTQAPVQVPAQTQTAAPAPASAPVAAPAGTAQTNDPSATQQTLAEKDQLARDLDPRTLADAFAPLLNAARAQEGLGPVTAHNLLEQAALAHAQDMEARDFFDHVAPDGGTLVDRVGVTGYAYCIVAENIARGQPTVQIVHTAWMNSPGHRANNLLPEITHFGLVLEDDSWVLVLGALSC